MRRTIPTVLLALISVNLAAFAAGPAQANPQVCFQFPNPQCEEGSWASVDYYQNPGLEFCVNTLIDSTPFFCPTHSQRPCPPETESIGAFETRSDVLFAPDYRAYSFDSAATSETVTVTREGPATTTVFARLLRAAADGHCEDASGDVDSDGWVNLGRGTTFTLATFAPYDATRTVSNTYYLELFAPEQSWEPVQYGVTRAGPALAN